MPRLVLTKGPQVDGSKQGFHLQGFVDVKTIPARCPLCGGSMKLIEDGYARIHILYEDEGKTVAEHENFSEFGNKEFCLLCSEGHEFVIEEQKADGHNRHRWSDVDPDLGPDFTWG